MAKKVPHKIPHKIITSKKLEMTIQDKPNSKNQKYKKKEEQK